MHRLSGMYHPITGTPFQSDETYMEWAPCDALKPYIRCFWGTKQPVHGGKKEGQQGIVIPDTCMDVIFDINYSRNAISDVFCALDDTSEMSVGESFPDTVATFGIRFYAWTACVFSDIHFAGTMNGRLSCDMVISDIKKALAPLLFDIHGMEGKIQAAEKVLLERMEKNKADPNVLNAVYRMLETRGRERITEIEGYTGVSSRGLERAFQRQMGIAPKAFSSLVRYQLLWQEMVSSRHFDVIDAVEKYGYTDQAHLLHDFKRHHLMTPAQALEFAKTYR